MLTLLSCLVLAWPAADASVETPTSYKKLKGRALARFYRTKGASCAGQRVRLILPTPVLGKKNLKLLRGKRWVSFTSKGVTFYAERTNPYLVQTVRKLARKKGGKLIVKGVVTPWKKTKKKGRTYAVRVRTVQRIR